MTKFEMIKFMEKHPGVKISHVFFDQNEYLYQGDDGRVYDEMDYLFEDWDGDHNGIRMRVGKKWDEGWYVLDSHKPNDFKKEQHIPTFKVIPLSNERIYRFL